MAYNPHVYFIEITGHGLLKIGTSQAPIGRLGQIKAWCPFPMKIIGQVPGGLLAEAFMHDEFRALRHQGEWFYLTAGLKEFVAGVVAAGRHPYGALPPDVREWAGAKYAEAALAKIGMTLDAFGESLGIGRSNVRLWHKYGIPLVHLPVILRLLSDAGIKADIWDLFAPQYRKAA